MKRSERAKQFMPFSALKRFSEELEKAEKILCEKRELLDDEAEEINRQLSNIETGSKIEIEYYSLGEYVKIIGMVEKTDKIFRTIRVDGIDIKIPNIASVKIII